MNIRRRLDLEMARRGVVTNQKEASKLIEERRIIVDGALAMKSSRLVAGSQSIRIIDLPDRYVSRGALKLEAALKYFQLDIRGQRVLDVGAGTGGFTDCLLAHGASSVLAVDVGRSQFHERLRSDPRVEISERTDIRSLDPILVGAPFMTIVVDLSFISLQSVISQLFALSSDDSTLVLLVKPQFEASYNEASKGKGVIRDPIIWERVLGEISKSVSEIGGTVTGGMVSPITGAEGNVEFLIQVVPVIVRSKFKPVVLSALVPKDTGKETV